MPNKLRLSFLHLLIFFTSSCSNAEGNKAIIFFESMPSLKQEQELVRNFESYMSSNNLSEHLKNQNWIETFLIKRYAFSSVEIFIQTKVPKYIWKEKFYLDTKLSKFLYFHEHPELLHLDMSIESVGQWVMVEEKFMALLGSNNLKIISVSHNEAEGWYFIMDNNLRINLGADLSDAILNNLSLTIKYMFEKNLTPSIIDLRYKNGAALNYGK